MREPGVRDLVASHFYEISEDQDELAFNPDWALFCAGRGGHLLRMRRERTGNWWISMFLIHADPSTSLNGAWDYPWYLDPEYSPRDGRL